MIDHIDRRNCLSDDMCMHEQCTMLNQEEDKKRRERARTDVAQDRF